MKVYNPTNAEITQMAGGNLYRIPAKTEIEVDDADGKKLIQKSLGLIIVRTTEVLRVGAISQTPSKPAGPVKKSNNSKKKKWFGRK